jgi:hypothetical protein
LKLVLPRAILPAVLPACAVNLYVNAYQRALAAVISNGNQVNAQANPAPGTVMDFNLEHLGANQWVTSAASQTVAYLQRLWAPRMVVVALKSLVVLSLKRCSVRECKEPTAKHLDLKCACVNKSPCGLLPHVQCLRSQQQQDLYAMLAHEVLLLASLLASKAQANSRW